MHTTTDAFQHSDDSLCVDLTHEIGYPLSIHVNSIGHHQPLFWQSWSDQELLEASCFLQAPGLPVAMFITQEQLNSVPQHALAIAMAMPVKQYQLLQGMLVSSAAMELALSNPLLFMLLVDHAEQHRLDESLFKALVRKKRTEILRYLQFPSSPSTVKLLARIDVEQHLFVDLKAVITVFRDTEILNSLRHLQQPCINHFLLLQRYQGLYWSGLLNMVNPQSSMADLGYIQRLAQDSCTLGANQDSLRTVTSVQALKELHDRLVFRHNRMSVDLRAEHHQSKYGDFPKPPLPGNAHIVPISSWHELAFEGLHMRHCVGAYHQRIYEGRVFIYKVLTEQRVTLSLRPQGSDWLVDEARSFANAPACEETMALVHNWFTAANKANQQAAPQD